MLTIPEPMLAIMLAIPEPMLAIMLAIVDERGGAELGEPGNSA